MPGPKEYNVPDELVQEREAVFGSVLRQHPGLWMFLPWATTDREVAPGHVAMVPNAMSDMSYEEAQKLLAYGMSLLLTLRNDIGKEPGAPKDFVADVQLLTRRFMEERS